MLIFLGLYQPTNSNYLIELEYMLEKGQVTNKK